MPRKKKPGSRGPSPDKSVSMAGSGGQYGSSHLWNEVNSAGESHVQTRQEQAFLQLQEMFQSVDQDVIRMILQESDWKVETALDRLLQLTPPDSDGGEFHMFQHPPPSLQSVANPIHGGPRPSMPPPPPNQLNLMSRLPSANQAVLSNNVQGLTMLSPRTPQVVGLDFPHFAHQHSSQNEVKSALDALDSYAQNSMGNYMVTNLDNEPSYGSSMFDLNINEADAQRRVFDNANNQYSFTGNQGIGYDHQSQNKQGFALQGHGRYDRPVTTQNTYGGLQDYSVQSMGMRPQQLSPEGHRNFNTIDYTPVNNIHSNAQTDWSMPAQNSVVHTQQAQPKTNNNLTSPDQTGLNKIESYSYLGKTFGNNNQWSSGEVEVTKVPSVPERPVTVSNLPPPAPLPPRKDKPTKTMPPEKRVRPIRSIRHPNISLDPTERENLEKLIEEVIIGGVGEGLIDSDETTSEDEEEDSSGDPELSSGSTDSKKDNKSEGKQDESMAKVYQSQLKVAQKHMKNMPPRFLRKLQIAQKTDPSDPDQEIEAEIELDEKLLLPTEKEKKPKSEPKKHKKRLLEMLDPYFDDFGPDSDGSGETVTAVSKTAASTKTETAVQYTTASSTATITTTAHPSTQGLTRPHTESSPQPQFNPQIVQPGGPNQGTVMRQAAVNCEDLEREFMRSTTIALTHENTFGYAEPPPQIQRVSKIREETIMDQYGFSERDRKTQFSVDAPEFIPRAFTPINPPQPMLGDRSSMERAMPMQPFPLRAGSPFHSPLGRMSPVLIPHLSPVGAVQGRHSPAPSPAFLIPKAAPPPNALAAAAAAAALQQPVRPSLPVLPPGYPPYSMQYTYPPPPAPGFPPHLYRTPFLPPGGTAFPTGRSSESKKSAPQSSESIVAVTGSKNSMRPSPAMFFNNKPVSTTMPHVGDAVPMEKNVHLMATRSNCSTIPATTSNLVCGATTKLYTHSAGQMTTYTHAVHSTAYTHSVQSTAAPHPFVPDKIQLQTKMAVSSPTTSDLSSSRPSSAVVSSSQQDIAAKVLEMVHHLAKEGSKVMIILRGCPGSGKSTLAKTLQYKGVVLSTDDFFMRGNVYEFDYGKIGEAHDWNQRRARESLAGNRSPVIIDNTNAQMWEMKVYVKMALQYEYFVQILEPNTPWKFEAKELERRNTHGVGREGIERMLDRYEHDVTIEKILNAPDKKEENKDQGENSDTPAKRHRRKKRKRKRGRHKARAIEQDDDKAETSDEESTPDRDVARITVTNRLSGSDKEGSSDQAAIENVENSDKTLETVAEHPAEIECIVTETTTEQRTVSVSSTKNINCVVEKSNTGKEKVANVTTDDETDKKQEDSLLDGTTSTEMVESSTGGLSASDSGLLLEDTNNHNNGRHIATSNVYEKDSLDVIDTTLEAHPDIESEQCAAKDDEVCLETVDVFINKEIQEVVRAAMGDPEGSQDETEVEVVTINADSEIDNNDKSLEVAAITERVSPVTAETNEILVNHEEIISEQSPRSLISNSNENSSYQQTGYIEKNDHENSYSEKQTENGMASLQEEIKSDLAGESHSSGEVKSIDNDHTSSPPLSPEDEQNVSLSPSMSSKLRETIEKTLRKIMLAKAAEASPREIEQLLREQLRKCDAPESVTQEVEQIIWQKVLEKLLCDEQQLELNGQDEGLEISSNVTNELADVVDAELLELQGLSTGADDMVSQDLDRQFEEYTQNLIKEELSKIEAQREHSGMSEEAYWSAPHNHTDPYAIHVQTFGVTRWPTSQKNEAVESSSSSDVGVSSDNGSPLTPVPPLQSDPKSQRTRRDRNKHHQAHSQSPHLDSNVVSQLMATDWELPEFPVRSASVGSRPAVKIVERKDESTYTHPKDFKEVERILLGLSANFEDFETVLTTTPRVITPQTHPLYHQHSLESPSHKICVDASSSTSDLESLLQPDGIYFLKCCFPTVTEEDLGEVLNQCEGHIEWTVNILLDAGYEYNQPKTVQETTTAVLNVTSAPTVAIPECSPTTNSHPPVYLQSPPALSLLAHEHLSSQQIVSGQLQEKFIQGSVDRIHTIEQFIKQHTSSENQELVNVATDVSTTPELGLVTGTADNIVVGDTGLTSGQATDAKPWRSMGLDLIGAYGDDEVGNEEMEEEQGEVDVMTLQLSNDLAKQLITLFGPVGFHISPESLSGDDLKVTLNQKAAKQLHRCWSLSVQHKFQVEEEAINSMLLDDEAYARQLQREEEMLHSGGSTTTVAAGYSPGISLTSRTSPPASLQEIMEEEMAIQLSKEHYMETSASGKQQDVTLATMLKRQKLQAMFPGMDHTVLEQVFESNNYCLESTRAVLQAMLDSQEPVQNVMTQEAMAAYEEQMIKHAQQESLKEHQWLGAQEEIIKGRAFQDLADPTYQDFRTEASMHYRLRQECFQKAQEAYTRGMKAAASLYSQQGHLHTQKLHEANQRAAEKIMEHRNTNLDVTNTVDLHGLHVEEALDALQAVIIQREQELRQTPDKRLCQLLVVTGRGTHSRGGVAKIKPAVIAFLNKHKYSFAEVRPAVLKVLLKYRD